MELFQDIAFLQKLYRNQDQIAFRGSFLKAFSNRKYSVRDILLRFLQEPQNKRIVDIGAGTGTFLRKIEENYPHNVFAALDIVENAEGRNSPRIDYRIYDGKNFPDDFGKWDIILLMHVLYHVPDLLSFLDEIRAHLNERGMICITTKSRDTLAGIEVIFQEIVSQSFPAWHVPPYRDESHFCRENGLEILQKNFSLTQYSIEDYHFETQIIVDDYGALMKYILSTPRYNPLTYHATTSEESYRVLWEKAWGARLLYTDIVKETLYVITQKSWI